MTHKRSINLLPRKERTALLSLRLNHIAIRVAAVSLLVFCCTVLFSVVYLRIQYDRFNGLKQEVQDLELRISERKAVEGLATITSEKLGVLERLNGINRRYSRLLRETLGLETPMVRILSIAVGKNRSMTLAVTAQTSQALEEFVEGLIRGEASGQFTDITASGILRERTGSYSLTISLTPDATLFQSL